LETLLVLADPDRGGRRTAEAIAHGLAFGTPEGFGQQLRSIFLSFVRPTLSKYDGGSPNDVSSLEESSSLDDRREGQDLQLLSLKVLSTCLDNILKNEEDYLSNEAMMLDLASEFWSQTIQTLLDRLEGCSDRPHDAAWAAKCLRTLEVLQPDLLIPLTEAGAIAKTAKAFEYGRQHHLLLERESKKLLRCFELVTS
jgi:hypothetical protein